MCNLPTNHGINSIHQIHKTLVCMKYIHMAHLWRIQMTLWDDWFWPNVLERIQCSRIIIYTSSNKDTTTQPKVTSCKSLFTIIWHSGWSMIVGNLEKEPSNLPLNISKDESDHIHPQKITLLQVTGNFQHFYGMYIHHLVKNTGGPVGILLR